MFGRLVVRQHRQDRQGQRQRAGGLPGFAQLLDHGVEPRAQLGVQAQRRGGGLLRPRGVPGSRQGKAEQEVGLRGVFEHPGCHAVGTGRRRVVPLACQGQPQVHPQQAVFRAFGRHAAEVLGGPGVVPQLEQRHAEVEAGLDVAGDDAERGAEGLGRSLVVPGSGQEHAELELDLGVVWIQGRCPLVGLQGGLGPTQGFQGQAQVEGDPRPDLALGSLDPAQGLERGLDPLGLTLGHGQVDLDRDLLWVQLGRLGQRLERLVHAAAAQLDQAQVVDRTEVLGVQPGGPLELPLGAARIAGLGQGHAQGQEDLGIPLLLLGDGLEPRHLTLLGRGTLLCGLGVSGLGSSGLGVSGLGVSGLGRRCTRRCRPGYRTWGTAAKGQQDHGGQTQQLGARRQHASELRHPYAQTGALLGRMLEYRVYSQIDRYHHRGVS